MNHKKTKATDQNLNAPADSEITTMSLKTGIMQLLWDKSLTLITCKDLVSTEPLFFLGTKVLLTEILTQANFMPESFV